MNNESSPTEAAVERMQRLRRRLVELESRVVPGRVELFERLSFTRRVSRDRAGDGRAFQEGREEGIALRVRHPDGGVGFAADSGGGDRPLDALLAAALPSRETSDPWHRPDSVARLDHEEGGPLPSAADLEGWLTGVRLGAEAVEAWVEAGRTLETWIGPAGAAASRLRSRVWAMARLRHEDGGPPRERVAVIAAHALGGLNAEDWRSVDPNPPITGAPLARVDPDAPVLVLPAASAVLVRALVDAIHGPGCEAGGAVGPGWRIGDEPTARGALFGGAFDDAGFPTRTTLLADGERVLGTIHGPGRLRRASFRDPPTPMSAWLVIEPREVQPPPEGTVVQDVVVDRLESRRLLRIHGWTVRGGSPRNPVRGAVVPFDPRTWALRCLGTHGPARASHHGVLTPALIFGEPRQA